MFTTLEVIAISFISFLCPEQITYNMFSGIVKDARFPDTFALRQK